MFLEYRPRLYVSQNSTALRTTASRRVTQTGQVSRNNIYIGRALQRAMLMYLSTTKSPENTAQWGKIKHYHSSHVPQPIFCAGIFFFAHYYCYFLLFLSKRYWLHASWTAIRLGAATGGGDLNLVKKNFQKILWSLCEPKLIKDHSVWSFTPETWREKESIKSSRFAPSLQGPS